MAYKVFIGVGHGGNDPGSAKYIVEKDANLVMAKACAAYLEKFGVLTRLSRTKDENDPVSEEVKECNAFAPDVAIDVHNNAGGGDGFEFFHHYKGGKGLEVGRCIEKEVVKLGQNSRGAKTLINSQGEDYFAFIRNTKAPAIILEGVFVDNKLDAEIANTKEEQEAFGVAYAKGILNYFGVSDTVSKVRIMGKAEVSAEKLKAFLKSKNATVAQEYVDLIDVFLEEGVVEGVRGDIAACQAFKETGYFRFGGDVLPEQNNFAGIGAVGGGSKGAYFATPREGVRAQIQHLKAYASKEPLANKCVDPRFDLVVRGVAPCVTDLNGRWAVPGTTYGEDILKLLEEAMSTVVSGDGNDTVYKVQSGAFKDRKNAEDLVERLHKAGFDAFIV